MSTENQRYLKRRRHRRAKTKKLLARLEKAPDAREKAKVIDKLWKVNPYVIPQGAAK
jgi:U3 small nucleolar ribonucleoprotein component